MIGSIHLADIGARRALPLLGHPIAAASVPGLRYAARVAAAPLATPPLPRSVLIVGAGRSGTSCLAGMFGPDTHRHGDDLYAPSPSNPTALSART